MERTLKKKKKCIGASILCFSRSPDNLVYFLLGREKYARYYKDSGKFSDFGGACKKNESAEECASREFYEETLNSILLFLKERPNHFLLPVRNRSHLTNLLTKKTYYARVDFEFEKKKICVYSTFLIEVPWMPEINDKYKFLMKLHQHKNLEKDKIAYMSPQMILNTSNNSKKNSFQNMLPRTFFKNRFSKIFPMCFRNDFVFIKKSLRLNFNGLENQKKCLIFKKSWERGQKITDCAPKTLLFKNLNHGFRNTTIGKKCRGNRSSCRGRWQRNYQKNQSEFQDRIATSSTYTK